MGLSARTKAGRSVRPVPGRHRGMVLVWTAVVLMVLIGFVGLSIDWGKLAWNVHQLQNAADASALAGAQVVKFDPNRAIQRAREYGFHNHAEGLPVSLSTSDGVDIQVGRWIVHRRQFVPTISGPDAVQVRVRRSAGLGGGRPPLALLFGPIFGTRTVDASREAVAWNDTYSGAALICLSETASPGLRVWGNPVVDVAEGGIHVNSGADPAVMVGGSASINCGYLNSVGGTQPTPDGNWERHQIEEFGVYTEDVEPIADPVKEAMGGIDRLPLPTDAEGNLIYGTILNPDGTTAQAGSETLTGSVTLGPGYYPGGMRMEGNPNVVLDPTLGWDAATMGQPIFFFGGVGLLANNGTLTGHGVTVYITADSTAQLDLGGNIELDLISPGDHAGTDVDGMAGIGIWVDPENPNTIILRGCPGEGVQGTMYFPGSHLDLRGTPGKGTPQIIAGSMDISGNVNVGVNYDRRNFGDRLKVSYIVK